MSSPGGRRAIRPGDFGDLGYAAPVTTASQQRAELASAFVGVPLGLVFAEGDDMAALSEAGAGALTVEEPPALADADVYLVLPSDIGTEIVDILADSDRELLGEAVRDGLLVRGSFHEGEATLLEVEEAISPKDALDADPAYAASVTVGGGADALSAINALPHLQVTMVSSLLDDETLEKMLRRREYAGPSWRVPLELRDTLEGVSPTYAWSRRRLDGSVGVELALFVEEEDLVALLRPVRLTPP